MNKLVKINVRPDDRRRIKQAALDSNMPLVAIVPFVMDLWQMRPVLEQFVSEVQANLEQDYLGRLDMKKLLVELRAVNGNKRQ